jgi:hypothetical protein
MIALKLIVGYSPKIFWKVATDNFMSQKIPSSASGKICDAKKPAVVAVLEKNSNENVGKLI